MYFYASNNKISYSFSDLFDIPIYPSLRCVGYAFKYLFEVITNRVRIAGKYAVVRGEFTMSLFSQVCVSK